MMVYCCMITMCPAQIEDHVNDQVQELCKSAYLWYSDNQ